MIASSIAHEHPAVKRMHRYTTRQDWENAPRDVLSAYLRALWIVYPRLAERAANEWGIELG